MQVKIDIEFVEPLKMVQTLPTGKLRLLKFKIEIKSKLNRSYMNLEKLLLRGPVASKKQIDVIKHNRKAINQWRTN